MSITIIMLLAAMGIFVGLLITPPSLSLSRVPVIKILKRITKQTEQSSKNGKPEWLKE